MTTLLRPFVLFLGLSSACLQGQSPDLRELTRGTEALIETLTDLSERVTALESTSSPPPSSPHTVSSWSALTQRLQAGEPVHVDSSIQVQGNGTFTSPATLSFGPQGSLAFSGHRVVFNVPILNPDNHPIFLGVDSDESYPGRWEPQATSVSGTFGGQWTRDPRWWGLRTSINPSYATYQEAEGNNVAIAAAALSGPYAGAAIPTVVQLPPGKISIRRTVRLDGLRSTLRGAGTVAVSATHLWAHSERWQFSQIHRIKTRHFPGGTTPVVEIGYERQPAPAKNPDEGFQCGVENLTVVCPLNTVVPMSGIMWESGLQEISTIRYVAVTNYGGYGIGGPTLQHQRHNDPQPSNFLPQVNTVVFEKLWVHSPNRRFPNAIGMNVHGLNYEIRNLTIHHHNGNAVFRQPCLIVSSREAARVSQAHLEHNPPRGVDSAAPALLVPADRTASRLHLDGVYCFLAANLYPDTKSEVVRIENPRAAITLTNIHHRTGTVGALNALTQCVNDVPRGKASGAQFQRGSGKVLALYARQFDYATQGYHVSTTDPALK